MMINKPRKFLQVRDVSTGRILAHAPSLDAARAVMKRFPANSTMVTDARYRGLSGAGERGKMRTKGIIGNPGLGRAFYFLGSYTNKIIAAKQERKHPGSFLHYKNGRWYLLKPKKILSNPKGSKNLVTIYRRVLSIHAQKLGFHRHCDAECKRVNHKYVHDFKPGAKLLGIPDGAALMLADGRIFRLSNGSMLVSDREY